MLVTCVDVYMYAIMSVHASIENLKIWIIINNAYKREKFLKLGCNNLGKERLE